MVGPSLTITSSYQYIEILMCVRVCVTEVGCSWGGTRLVTCDLCTSMY